ncbi:hypothetical protein ABTB83_19110, partial [Acinetobacter baumannii]
MFVNADQRIKELKHLNQYAPTADTDGGGDDDEQYICEECRAAGTQCQFPIYSDKIRWCEKQYATTKKAKAGA